ncbi:transmembrane transcriptional regulator (anti-sigma factor) [Pandoraea capi]|uniref:Transmembrane transcriptional regulator (Anti-sigma factor) n=1 Tax=Pandoraea capi TaxID=2508286 RepID=A0ABY6VZD3_9BURK|nr:anti-sigma factor [Pandoraea capi]VVD81199.1 transmembrane transcriptional regulator (anti-sigma factor) [Pandoraea capi]
MNKPDDPRDAAATSSDDAGSATARNEDTTLGKMLRDGSLHYKAPQALRERLRDELTQAERRATSAQDTAASSADAVSTPKPEPKSEPKPSHSSTTSNAPNVPKPSGKPVDLAWGSSLAPWLFGGAGGAILGGLAVAMALLVGRPPVPAPTPDPQTPTGLQPQEIVSSHVRALLSQHPIDVVSTDQHTVKPWFNGRLDYAPPVVDLSAKGFPLAGGRLDYVGQRTVAVLIYHTDKHPIDLYVYPARDKASAAPMISGADGYAIARWRRNGMTYWAITDAEPSHLRVFVEALQAAT